jgi:NodT family efflux transporter outer membrane factor (OMF) lipoprotein
MRYARRHSTFLGIAVFLLLSGCVLGPNYKRPLLDTPAAFRGDQQTPGEKSLADSKWPELFQDPALTDLVTTALTQNYDMRIAAERVLQARAQFGVTRSDLLPTVDIAGGFSANRNSQVGSIRFLPPGVSTDVSYTQLGFGLGWELDLWGRLRRLKESALAQYLATEEAQHAVTTTVIADTTSAYLTLREFDMELEIAVKTRDVAEDSLRLTRLRQQQGVATALDVYQAEQFFRSATAQIAASERAIAQTENALSILVGRSPSGVARGRKLDELAAPAQVPVGLPSTLLAKRPDIRAAEQTLIAANAQIGAARAMYFPQISLTGFMGGQSRALTDLFTGPARQWNFNPVANLPIFNAGRVRSNVRLTEAVQREATIRYEQSIQTAFREVSDALVGFQKTTEQLEQQDLLVEALRESNRLSLLRYQGGLDSYLQVLDAERNLFVGELVQSRLRRDVLLSIVQLYRSLGGGWQ